ncbi:MAG: hypothetical protein AAFP17_09435, partial [Pseudomonadota bacterium]
ALLIEGEKLYARLGRFGDAPLISLTVIKEMFPDLYADPNAARVHSVAGFEDFQRGESAGLRAMEVEGVPTLVATGTGASRWSSPIYRTARPATLAHAAWDMALSRLTPADVVSYDLSLEVWTKAQSAGATPGTSVELTAPNTGPQAARLREKLRLPNGRPVRGVEAYRVHFRAAVFHDTRLEERQIGLPREESVGAPLLRAVNVLEEVETAYDFASLHELIAAAESYDFLDAPQPRLLTLRLPLRASLREGESVRLRVAPGIFKRLEARLEADIRLRPPPIEKSVG